MTHLRDAVENELYAEDREGNKHDGFRHHIRTWREGEQAYFVAKHYGLSMQEVWDMSKDAFEKSFIWANAAERIKADEIEKATDGAKNKTRVASTHGVMPFSEGW